jgi:hypothetical protein
MMKKYAAMVVATGLAGAVALACSVTTNNPVGGTTGDGGTTSDGGRVDSGPRPQPDGGNTLACYDASAAAGLIFQDTKLDQAKCSVAQIDAFYDASFKAGSNEASCNAFVGEKDRPVAANVDCINCVFPFYNPNLSAETAMTLLSPAFVLGGQFIFPNDTACEMKAANAPAGCGKKATDSLYCIGETCGECEQADINACAAQSEKDACKDGLPEAACTMAVTANMAAAQAKCGTTNMTFETIFKPLARAFCGGPQ